MTLQYIKGLFAFGYGLALFQVTQDYFYDIRASLGPSMLPTFRDAGDVILVDKISWMWKPYELGDIVIFQSPFNPGMVLCKRICGLQGQTIKIHGWDVQVPEGYFWVLGDNKDESLDSRSFGLIPKSLIEGRVIYKIWK